MFTDVYLVFLFLFAHLLQGHKTRIAPLADSPNASSNKSLVFIIHSVVKSL
jgi:hypothetical protein